MVTTDEFESPRLPLRTAWEAAVELCRLLEPNCARIKIAGSIRRRKETVKDIELVLAPRYGPVVARQDLFGDVTETRDLAHAQLEQMLETGEIAHRPDKNGRPSFGPSAKRIVWHGVPVDIFGVLPPRTQWGVILAIRTGSAAFTTSFMSAKRIGGVLPDDMIVRHGQLFRTVDSVWVPVKSDERQAFPHDRLQLIETPEEEDFFAAIGLPWIAPEER